MPGGHVGASECSLLRRIRINVAAVEMRREGDSQGHHRGSIWKTDAKWLIVHGRKNCLLTYREKVVELFSYHQLQ